MKTTTALNQHNELPSPRFLVFRYFLIILAPLLILLTLLLWQFYQMEREKTFIEIKTLDSQRLETEQKLINNEFTTVVGDLLALAGQNEILQFADNGNTQLLNELAKEYILHSKSKGIYDQIRFISETGQELVRINFNHGSPALTPLAELQNKRKRYYFHETMQLPKNGIFTSPLDLNKEHGKIELPLKPMIRFGTPIFNSRGQRKGIVLLNYSADQLLSRMTTQTNKTYGELLLINADGYWLHSPNEDEAWGFMYPNGKNRVFGKKFPDAWDRMNSKESGSFFTDNGFFNFKRIHPLQKLKISPFATSTPDKQYPWVIISRVSPQHLKALSGETSTHFLKLFTLLALGAIFSATLISWALMKRKTAEQSALVAWKQKEEFMLWRTSQDSALTELSESLLAEMSLEEITESVINKSRMLTDSEFAFAAYIDNETGNFICPAEIDNIMEECKLASKEMLVNKCRGLWGWVIDNQQSILANNPSDDPRSTGLPQGHISIQKFLSVPAMINDKLVGIISLANSTRDYTERDLGVVRRIATLYALAIQRKRTDESIHRLLLGTAAVTGEQFFATMVEQLAKCLGTKYVMVGEIRPESQTEVTGVAFWKDDALGDPPNYTLAGTPSAKVAETGFCIYEDNISGLFPAGHSLCNLNAKFYAGIPLKDSTGSLTGILCALHDAPLAEISHIHEIFQIFSNRTSGEIERQRALNALAHAKEAAESANNAKSRFLANMSHELRTPLNAIIGFTTVLQEQHFGPLNDKQLSYTNDIRNGGDQLLTSINDILDLAKIEAGKMPLLTMPAEIALLVKQGIQKIKETATQCGIKIDLDIDPKVEELIIDIDERKLKKAFHNLLINAVKFTPDNGHITISMLRHENDLNIDITDTGIGIAEEDINRIFEPFYQIKNEYRGKTPGTGLGLPLTKTLVEMHGGTLKVKSKGVDQGTCFTISLPIKESQIGSTSNPLSNNS
ncbi:MAG: ATP-binding protein [Desulfobulbaceae bacterium]|nr:ATP-binding protein [Desulfobulbaceae bacterium]